MRALPCLAGRGFGIDLTPWPALGAYLERVGARPAVTEALAAEGLSKAA